MSASGDRADQHPAWTTLQKKEEPRAARYAAVLERMIAPDGSFPALGRSIVYRCGAFHALAQAARLCGVGLTTCRAVLDDLVAKGQLHRMRDGQYTAR